MDKEDCIQVLLAALQQPWWKSCDSVTDWDLKNVLWKAGLLLTPGQVAALFADILRRGLISGHDRRIDDRVVGLWAVRITSSGEEWLAQHAHANNRRNTQPLDETQGPVPIPAQPSLVGADRQDGDRPDERDPSNDETASDVP